MGTAIKSAGGAFVKSYGGVRADKYAHYFGRYGMGIAAYEGKMFLFGGKAWSSNSQTDYVDMGDLWYTTDGIKWTLRSTLCVDEGTGLPSGETITPRVFPALVSNGSGLFIFLGDPNTDNWMCRDGIGRVWSPFDLLSGSGLSHWDNMSINFTAINKLAVLGFSGIFGQMGGNIYPNAYGNWQSGGTAFTSPLPPTETASAELDGNAYVTGGRIGTTFYNNTYVTSDGLNFTRITGNYSKCSFHVMLSMGGALYIIARLPSNVMEVWKSTDGASWTKLTDSPEFGLRYHYSGCVFDDKLWILGGKRVSPVNAAQAYSDVWYSSDGITWTEAVRFAPWGKFA